MMYESTTDQETMQYCVEFYRQHLPDVLEMMGDTILKPQFLQEDIEDALGTLQLSYEEQLTNPANSSVLTDSIMESCFGKSQQLGKPTLFIKEDVTRESLLKFLRKYFRPERCVVTGVGVNHEELVSLVERYFQFEDVEQANTTIGGLPILNTYERLSQSRTKPVFIGGEKRIYYTEQPLEMMRQNLASLTASVISFEGVSIYDPDVFAIHVLETALGGGDSFSTGGPGKGILSIINRNFLGYYEFWNMMCQHNAYTDTGVFCIHASAMHETAERLVPGIIQCYAKMLDLIKIDDLKRAKLRFKSMVLRGMEGNMGLSQKMASDIMFIDKFRGTNYLCEEIDKVQMEDLQRVVVRMMNASKNPAVVVIGESDKVNSKQEIDQAVNMIRTVFNKRYAHTLKKQ